MHASDDRSASGQGPRQSTFESSDLAVFDGVLQDLIADLNGRSSPLAAPHALGATRDRIATLIFECARDGCRDHATLRQRVAASLSKEWDGWAPSSG
jgi:hypothetical protein